MDNILDYGVVITKTIYQTAKTVITFIPKLLTFLYDNLMYIPNEIKIILITVIGIIGTIFVYRFIK